MAGTWAKVSRIAPAAALVLLVAAGCGGAARPPDSVARGVPRVLAHEWAERASAIADAARAGNGCHALQLAESLRDDVIAKQAALPRRVRLPLLTGVNALADRLTCTQTVTTQTLPQKPPKPPDKRRGHHEHHGHDHGDEG